MKRAVIAVGLALATACALSSQPPPDDFPIAERQYRDGSRSLYHLHSPYGFVAMWEGGRASFYVYDKGRTNITTTSDLRSFVGMLSRIPDASEVAWVNTCAAPLHYLMPKEMLSEIEEVLKTKRFKMAGIDDNNFILCTCETTNLVFFTRALPARSANPQGAANGRQPFSAETSRASAAAASRRSP